MSASLRLTSLSAVKAFMNISASDDDELLVRLIDAASEYVEKWCSRSFALQTHSEEYSGPGGRSLLLRNFPVTSITSLTVDEVAVPARTASNKQGYTFDSIAVYVSDLYRFSDGVNNVSITYEAGYTDVPLDLEQACIEIVAARYRDRNRVGAQSMSMGGESVTFIPSELSRFARTVLQQYKSVVPQ